MPSGLLLLSLVFLIFLPPFFPGDTGPLALRVFTVLMLLVGTRTALGCHTLGPVVLPLSFMALVGSLLYWGVHNEFSVYAFLLSQIAFLTVVVIILMRYLLTDRAKVSLSKLYGAASVYLLIGLVWALAFALLEYTTPGSFTQSEFFQPMPGDANEHFQRFIGFSFITLTTLGYGHISPANAQADALTSAGAIVGQLYVAVVIARLVALQVNHSDADEATGDGNE